MLAHAISRLKEGDLFWFYVKAAIVSAALMFFTYMLRALLVYINWPPIDDDFLLFTIEAGLLFFCLIFLLNVFLLVAPLMKWKERWLLVFSIGLVALLLAALWSKFCIPSNTKSATFWSLGLLLGAMLALVMFFIGKMLGGFQANREKFRDLENTHHERRRKRR
jgi:hypothetical protein